MVVFLDLDEDVPDDPHLDPGQPGGFSGIQRLPLRGHVQVTNEPEDDDAGPSSDRPNPNINAVSAALGCYPIISQITQNIDLNTLHALSRTCRQIRSNILQYRTRLAQSTLRCENEALNTTPAPARAPSVPKWYILGEAGHLVSGGRTSSTCARDLVGDCRRCGRIICRNCTIKPPPPSLLPSRHRRLCPTCVTAPLTLLAASSSGPCVCPQAIHLCMPCGAKLVTADTTYKRVWTWRTRYTTYLGGLGTGIGEGNEGVKCARGKECLGAKDVEVEFECPSGGSTTSVSGSNSSSSDTSDGGESITTNTAGTGTGTVTIAGPGTPGTPSTDKEEAAGYWRQEIEGLGGVVKKKFRKRERVGRTVREWEDEREGGELLGREKEGVVRSWCGWCGRVVLGKKDLDALTLTLASASTLNAGSSSVGIASLARD